MSLITLLVPVVPTNLITESGEMLFSVFDPSLNSDLTNLTLSSKLLSSNSFFGEQKSSGLTFEVILTTYTTPSLYAAYFRDSSPRQTLFCSIITGRRGIRNETFLVFTEYNSH